MANFKKHIGQLNNTGVRCIVVFRQIPGDESHCLIIETDHLPDSYHDSVMEAVISPESQKTNDFYEILQRRTLSDGTNALTQMHQRGYLRKVPAANITLIPAPGQSLPLEILNAQLGNDTSLLKDMETEYKDEKLKQSQPEVADPAAVAEGLLLEAKMLEEEAELKRKEAYELNPELQPNKRGPGRPALTKSEKAARLEEQKVKRRERDRKKAAERKAEKKEKSLKEQIDAKILRDVQRESERLSSSD